MKTNFCHLKAGVGLFGRWGERSGKKIISFPNEVILGTSGSTNFNIRKMRIILSV